MKRISPGLIIVCALSAGSLLLMRSSITAFAASTNEWTLAAMGDSIITRPLSVHKGEPDFDQMVNTIKKADAAFTNLEINLFNLKEFKGYPQTGYNELGAPSGAKELREIGISLLNRANNHTGDWGVEGMMETDRILDEAGIVHAGTGATLGEAREPGYLYTKHGRFALIGLASTFAPESRGENPRPEIRGRPGLSALRTTSILEVDTTAFNQLADLAKQLNLRTNTPNGVLDFAGVRVKVGPHPGQRTYEMNQNDLNDILKWVRSARKQADHIIVNIHAHEQAGRIEEPADFLPKFAHAVIDAGADMFIGHGPHLLRGVEIYKGKAIFYSMGNFIFQNDTIEPMSEDMYENAGLKPDAMPSDIFDQRYKNDTAGFPASDDYWESVIAFSHYRDGQVQEIEFYPIYLDRTAGRPDRGSPHMADGAHAQRTLDRLAKLSAAYGTKISLEGNVGVWKAGEGAQ